jgi:hypothetical protein
MSSSIRTAVGGVVVVLLLLAPGILTATGRGER